MQDPHNMFERIGLTDDCVKQQEQMGIPPELLAALIAVESSGLQAAIRFEPHYRWLFKPEEFAARFGTTVDTEIALQKFSYGPLQIMGAVAREQGMHHNIWRLLQPNIGVSWACIYLRHLFDRYDGNWPDTIAAYNQGDNRKWIISGKYKNQGYVDKVLGKARDYGMDI